MKQISIPNAGQEMAIKKIFNVYKDYPSDVDFSKVYKDYVKSHHTDNTNVEDGALSIFHGWLNGLSVDDQGVKDIIKGIVYCDFEYDSETRTLYIRRDLTDSSQFQLISQFSWSCEKPVDKLVIGKEVTWFGFWTSVQKGAPGFCHDNFTIEYEEGRNKSLLLVGSTEIRGKGSVGCQIKIRLPKDTEFASCREDYGFIYDVYNQILFDYYSTMRMTFNGNLVRFSLANLFYKKSSEDFVSNYGMHWWRLTVNFKDRKISDYVFIGGHYGPACSFVGFDNIISIGIETFKDARWERQDLEIPNNLEILGDNAFEGFSGFKNGIVCLPKTLQNIGKEVFKNCKDLKRIECTWKQRTLLKSNNCVDKGVEIAVSDFEIVKEIDADTFANESIVNCDFTLPEKLEKIGDRAFKGFTGFKNGMICLPETVSEIGKEVFIGCSDLKCIECTWKQSMILKNNNCVDKGVKFHLTDKHSYSTEKIIDDVKLNEGANVVELFIDDMDLLTGIIIESGNRNVFTSVHSMSEDIVYINCFNLSKEMLDVSLKCKLTFSN